MSFSSLLSQITKDKKLLPQSKPISQSIASTKSSKKPSSIPLPSKTAPLKSSSRIQSYVENDDPAVRRLKEARRLEREKLEAAKGIKPKSKQQQSKSKTKPSAFTTSASSRRSFDLNNNGKSSSNNIPSLPVKSRFKFKPQKHVVNPRASTPAAPTSSLSTTTPKLSFKELMKQAESIDTSTSLSSVIPLKTAPKTSTKEPSKAYQSLQRSRRREEQSPPISLQSNNQRNIQTNSKDISKASAPLNRVLHSQQAPRKPPSFAKPNSELLNKLKQKKEYISQSNKRPNSNLKRSEKSSTYFEKDRKRDSYNIDAVDDEDEDVFGYDYEYDSQDDGFIVDDEDDIYNQNIDRERHINSMRSKGYSKDEIWEIFNRGKKRSRNYYDDYDSDDMEATGTEILEDEERTLKQAKLDDLKEQKLLEKRALDKKKLLRR